MNARDKAPAPLSPGRPDDELAPELELVLMRFRLRARRRVMWLRHVWSEDADLLDADAPAAEAVFFRSNKDVAPLNDALHAAEAALGARTGSRLFRLRSLFELSEQEFDLLQACAAVALDPALARTCAMLHGDLARTCMTADLAARLYEHGRCARLNPDSPLTRWQLVSEHLSPAGMPPVLTLDTGMREWLRGTNDLDQALIGIAHLQARLAPLDAWPVESTVTWLKTRLAARGIVPVRVCVLGRPSSGRRTFAAAVTAQLGLPLLSIRADELADETWRTLYLRAQRHAWLHGCALAWSGQAPLTRRWPQDVPPFPVQFVTAEQRAQLAAADGADVADVFIELPATGIADRRAVWKSVAPRGWRKEGIERLARHYRVEAGHIAQACASGPADMDEAGARVRELARASLGNLAQRLACPFGWDDLVVAPASRAMLRDLLYEAQTRNEWWERRESQRLFPQGRGLLALFNGPPGTGKTMAAQVIAGELGYDLLRIELSAVVSKFVGETSQNLERILSRAAHLDVVLLFDEADGLFGQRSAETRDAQDKFANTESAWLLQAIEAYPGIALLASNQRSAIDTAFMRRLRYVVEFGRPDARERLEIWRRVTAELAGPKLARSLDGGMERLAGNIESTGAQIKHAVLNATFMARREDAPLSVAHLLGGLERELAKDNRFLSAKERARMDCND